MDDINWTLIATGDSTLSISNPALPLPELRHAENVVSAGEERFILDSLGDFEWEGFDQRRRVYRREISQASESIQNVARRLKQRFGLDASHAAVEEYANPYQLRRKGDYMSNHIVTTFESPGICKDSQPCDCFSACIPLKAGAVLHWNRPLERQANCWSLTSPDHWTDVQLNRGSLMVQQGDLLWHWRSRVMGNALLLKFYRLPTLTADSPENDGFGYIPNPNTPPRGPMPPLTDILTLIVTTSPIKSNPSTELLERAMETFVYGGRDFCQCRKLIVCDGYRTKNVDEKVTQRHANVKQAMRNGIVTEDQAENYRLYKERLKELCAAAGADSIFCNTRVEELDSRHGYGFALRHALQLVDTPYVCVIQHDRTFMRPTPIRETLAAMWQHPHIKYVGMSMRSNLMYRDIFRSKYGRNYFEQLEDLVLRLPELQVDPTLYGPDSASIRIMLESAGDKLRENLLALREAYAGSAQCVEQQAWVQQHPSNCHQLTLTPTLFWYDNVHVCETAHYRDFCFEPSYKMVAKGGFVEDKLSPVLVRTVERLGLAQGHARFGCYLLDDHSGYFFTGHLDGGSYLTEAHRQEIMTKS